MTCGCEHPVTECDHEIEPPAGEAGVAHMKLHTAIPTGNLDREAKGQRELCESKWFSAAPWKKAK
jgi:hypothetical protein